LRLHAEADKLLELLDVRLMVVICFREIRTEVRVSISANGNLNRGGSVVKRKRFSVE